VKSCPGRHAAGLFGGPYRDNSTWSDDRALTADMFGFRAIDAFAPGMAAAADEACKSVDEVLSRDPNIVIDLNVLMSKIAYTIIVRAVFGNVDLAEMHALGRTLSESIGKLLAFLWAFIMGRQSVPADYVDAYAATREANCKMIDLLRELDRLGKLTDAQRSAPIIRLVLATANDPDGAYSKLGALFLPLIIAGHETTGHAMSWAFYEMSRNPEIENTILDEIKRYRASHGNRPLSTEDYDERPMSFALLAECLRRHQPLQSVARNPISDGVVPPDPRTGIGSFSYPAGAMVVCSIVGAHLDPDRWHDPYTFNLDRWLEGVHSSMSLSEKGRTVRANIRMREQAFDLLSFSDGPARCPGQHFNAHEFFLILDALVPRYRFEMVTSGEIGESEAMIVGPEPGRMGVRKRFALAAISLDFSGRITDFG
jgi:cytochrome P450